jgi:hypothetical protein
LVLETTAPVRALLIALALTACIDTELPPIDLVGPQLITLTPGTEEPLPLAPSIRLTFDEKLARVSIEPWDGSPSGTVLLMTRYDLDDDGVAELDDEGQPKANLTAAMISDLNAGEGGLTSSTYLARIVTCRVSLLEDDLTVLLQPQERLRPETDYLVVLSSQIRDAQGNRLGSPPTPEQERDGGLPHTLRVFRSSAGPPVLVSADLPGFNEVLPGGAVAPNRATITVTFNRAMGEAPGELQLILGDAVATVPLTAQRRGAEFLLSLPPLSEHTAHRSRCLEADDTWRLCPSQNYRLVLADLADSAGRVMLPTELSFSTAAAADTAAPQLIGVVEALAGETSVVLTWQTDEPSSSEVVVLGAPDRYVFGVPCSGDPCTHSVLVDGLTIGQTLHYFVRSRDGALNAFEGPQSEVATIDLPDIAITEFLASSGRDPDEAGEYIELHNYGQEEIDISAWVIAKAGSASSIEVAADTVLAPGGFLIVGGASFAVASFPGLSEAVVQRTGSAKLFSFGLSNSSFGATLSDADQRVLSVVPARSSTVGMGRHRERLDSDLFCSAAPTPASWSPADCD